MTLEEIKKVFRYGYIAKDKDGTWHWFSEEPKLPDDADYWGHYWYGEDEIKIGIIDGTVGINYLDSLIEIGEK